MPHRIAAWLARWPASQRLVTNLARVHAPPEGSPPDRNHLKMINFLQLNLNGNGEAEQLAFQTAVDTDADVFIFSEPFTRCGPKNKWVFSSDRKASMGISSRNRYSFSDKG